MTIAEISGYLNEEGLITQLPGKRQKRKLDRMIDFLSEQFTPGIKYTEKEVNAILNQHHSFNDPATLRRLLYGTGKMDRTLDGREYWRVQEI